MVGRLHPEAGVEADQEPATEPLPMSRRALRQSRKKSRASKDTQESPGSPAADVPTLEDAKSDDGDTPEAPADQGEPASVRRARAKAAKAAARAETRAARSVEMAAKRAQRRRDRQRRHEANPRRRYLIAAGIAVPTVAAIVLGMMWLLTPHVTHRTTADGTPIPAHAAGLGEPVAFGNLSSDTAIAIWTDFHSPLAKEQQVYSGGFLRRAAEKGTARVEYYLTDVLDQTDTEGSLRAANATLCADDQGFFFDYLAYAFDRQPIGFANPDDETSWVVPDGYSKSQLISWASELGIPNMDAFTQCVTDTRYKTYIKSLSTKFAELGYTTVPVLTKNGELFEEGDFSLDKFAAILGVPWADQ